VPIVTVLRPAIGSLCDCFMSFLWREPTIRDFSKSREGREHLSGLFNYDSWPRPSLRSILPNRQISATVLGRAFEIVLRLLIERLNSEFNFPVSLKERELVSRSKHRCLLDDFRRTGELTDDLANHVLRLANLQQKSFKTSRINTKFQPGDEEVIELRRMYELALRHGWQIQCSFHSGKVAGGFVAAEVDLLMDGRLIEIKSVENDAKHDEHLSQLFSYFLLTQAPIRSFGSFDVEELGIYYARHGVLVTRPVATLLRFLPQSMKRVAFDFILKFSCWKHMKGCDASDAAECDFAERLALIETLREVRPTPTWAREALKNSFVRSQSGHQSPQRIILPNDFLRLQNC
jgi:hypothetical protein